MDNEKNSKLGTRSKNKGKKRKANRIYNILLGVVIVAIIAVAIPIFSDKDDNQSDLADGNSSENKNTVNEDSDTKSDTVNKDPNENEVNNEDTEKDDSADAGDEEANDQEIIEEDQETSENDQETVENDQNANEGNTIVENSGDSNVQETYINDNWNPVGTKQTGEHVTNYSQGSADWEEMKQAIAYGAGLSVDRMTVWYLGNGGATNKAIGTVSSKDSNETYRVYIEWVDGQGWKPVKVELLKQNDKR